MFRAAQLETRRGEPLDALAGLLVAALVAGCGDPPPAPEPPPPPVVVTTAEVVARSPVIEVTAPVQAERRAMLRTETAGRVASAPLRAGAEVEEGQVVLRLDVPRTEISVSQAQARVSQAQAALRQATRAREDAEALAADGASTPSQIEQARDQEAEARARLTEAQGGVRSARAGVGEAVLQAPFAGVLADFRVHEGEYLGPGAEVAVLVDRTSLEAELRLDPVEGRGAREGGAVTVRPAGQPAQVFVGRITFVGDVLDPRTRRLPVRVAIEDPEHRLRAGEIATFEVAVGPPRDVVRLPERALVRRMGQRLVFVVRDGRAEAREVSVADVRDGMIELLAGALEAGDRVVVHGVDRVMDGGEVRIITEGGDRASDPASPSDAPAGSEAPGSETPGSETPGSETPADTAPRDPGAP